GVNWDGSGIDGLIVFERIVGAWNAGRLCERQEVHGVVLPVDGGVGGVFHHANDFMRPILRGLGRTGIAKPMANRIAVAEKLLDELLIDDGDGRRMQRVLRREAAPHDDTRPDGVEVLRGAFHPGRTFVQVRLALNLDAGSPVVLLHWRVGGEADFENAGNGVEAVFNGLVEWFNLCVLVTGRLWIDVDDVAVRGIQLHVDVLCLVEALREKARRDEQHQRKRGLQDNERALYERGSEGGRASIGAQDLGGLRPRRHHRWSKTKEDAGRERQHEGKTDDERRRRRIDRHVVLVGKGERQQRVRSEIRDGKAEQAAHTREKYTFRQQLAHDAAALRAERRANGQFSLAAHATHQQEVGNIGAGHEKDQRG